MSLYNAIFGQNPLSKLLLKIIGVEESEIPRFRDVHFSEDNSKIVIFTRTGGGNRECYCYDYSEIPKEGPFITDEDGVPHEEYCSSYMNEKLTQKENYIQDYDDEFDCTYAYFEFSILEEYSHIIHQYAPDNSEMNVGEKFINLVNKLQEDNKEDPEVQRALKIGEEIFSKLKG